MVGDERRLSRLQGEMNTSVLVDGGDRDGKETADVVWYVCSTCVLFSIFGAYSGEQNQASAERRSIG